MQVSSAQTSPSLSSSSWSSLPTFNRQAPPASADGPAKQGGETATIPAQASDTVSLHGSAATGALNPAQNAASNQPPEIFAEIWKDGRKIGVVYTDGQAALPSMLGGMSTSGSGTMVPYLRAEEISQQVGGEVRYVNLPALKVAQTRAQLRAAYGS